MIVAGIGFRGAAETGSLRAALSQALARAGNPKVDVLATLDDKARMGAFRALADDLGAEIAALPPDALRGQATRTKSERMAEQFGTGSLAEAAALAAAGPGASLLVVRVVSGDGMATAAIAESAEGPEK